MKDKRKKLTYEQIRKIKRKEEKSSRLQLLWSEFYSMLHDWLREKEELVEGTSEKFKRRHQRELKNARKTIKDIFSMRIQKVAIYALQSVLGKDKYEKLENSMTPEEIKIFRQLSRSLQSLKSKLFGSEEVMNLEDGINIKHNSESKKLILQPVEKEQAKSMISEMLGIDSMERSQLEEGYREKLRKMIKTQQTVKERLLKLTSFESMVEERFGELESSIKKLAKQITKIRIEELEEEEIEEEAQKKEVPERIPFEEEKLINFLKNHPNEAFSCRDISEKFKIQSTKASQKLYSLYDEGILKRNEIRERKPQEPKWEYYYGKGIVEKPKKPISKRIIEFLKKKEEKVTCRDVAKEFGISNDKASTRLSDLYRSGAFEVNREEIPESVKEKMKKAGSLKYRYWIGETEEEVFDSNQIQVIEGALDQNDGVFDYSFLKKVIPGIDMDVYQDEWFWKAFHNQEELENKLGVNIKADIGNRSLKLIK